MPFSNTADPLFFYQTAEHEEALAALIYGVTQRRGITVVTGQPGCGKTLLGLMLLRALGHDAEAATLLHTPENGHELFVTLCREFGIRCRHGHTTGELLDRLRGFLEARNDENRCVVALIDEAQNMSPETLEHLRMLGNIEKDSSKLLQIVLTGQPGLARTLQHPHLEQLRQRIFCSCQLKPLQRDQTRHYLRYRLSVAGAGEKELFTAEAFDLIHDRSGGLPRMINQIADNALLAAYSAGLKTVDRTTVNTCIKEMMSLQIGSSAPTEASPGGQATRPTVISGNIFAGDQAPVAPSCAVPSEAQIILSNSLSQQLTGALHRGSEVADRLEESTRHATRRADEVHTLLNNISGAIEELERVQRAAADARHASREGVASLDNVLAEGRRVAARLRKAKDSADGIVQDLNRKIGDLNERYRDQAKQLDEQYRDRLREFEQRVEALARMGDQHRGTSESIAQDLKGQIDQVLTVSGELNAYRDQAVREIEDAIQKVQAVNASVREESEKARATTEQSSSAAHRISILLEQAERCTHSLEHFVSDGRHSLDDLRRQAERIMPDALDLLARLGQAAEGAISREQSLNDVTGRAEFCRQAVSEENEKSGTLLERLEERLEALRTVIGESDRRAAHLSDTLRQADAVLSEALSCSHRLDEKIATAGRQEQDLASATEAAESTLARLIHQVSEQADFLQEQARSASQHLTGQIIEQSRQWQSRVDQIENLPSRLSIQVEEHTHLLNTRMREVQAASERLSALYEQAMASCGPAALQTLSEAQQRVGDLTAEVSARCAETHAELRRQVEQARGALETGTATAAEQTRKAEAACADLERHLRLLQQQADEARKIARDLDEQADAQSRNLSRRMIEVEKTAESFAEETRQRCRMLQEQIGAAEAVAATADQQTKALKAAIEEAEPATGRLVEYFREAKAVCGPEAMNNLELRTREINGLLERLREEGGELRAVTEVAASLRDQTAVSMQKGAEQHQVLLEVVRVGREQTVEAREVAEACGRQTHVLLETSTKLIEEAAIRTRELAVLLEAAPGERNQLQSVTERAAGLHAQMTAATQQGGAQHQALREAIVAAEGATVAADHKTQALEAMLREAEPVTSRLTECCSQAATVCGPEAMSIMEQQVREMEGLRERLREEGGELRAVTEVAVSLRDQTAVSMQKGAEQHQALLEAVRVGREQAIEAREAAEACGRETHILLETSTKQIEEAATRNKELAVLLEQAPGERDQLQSVTERAAGLHAQMTAATQQGGAQHQALREAIDTADKQTAETRAATEACGRQTQILSETAENQQRELTARLQDLAQGIQQLRQISEHAGRMLQQVEEGTNQAAGQADTLRQLSQAIEGQIQDLTGRTEQAGQLSTRMAELNELARQICSPEALELLESKYGQLLDLLARAAAQGDGLATATETAATCRQELIEQTQTAETARESLREVLNTAGACSDLYNELAGYAQRQLADLDERMTEARSVAERLIRQFEEESNALSDRIEQAEAAGRHVSEQIGGQAAEVRSRIDELTAAAVRSDEQARQLRSGITTAATLTARLADETNRQEQTLHVRIGEAKDVAQELVTETVESAEVLRQQVADARTAYDQLAALSEQARETCGPQVREALCDKQREIEHLLERTAEQCGQLWATTEAAEAVRGQVYDSTCRATHLDQALNQSRVSADEKLGELRQVLEGLEEKSATFTAAGQRQVRELCERIEEAARQAESLEGCAQQAAQTQTDLHGVLETARADSEVYDRLSDEAGRKLRALAERIEQAERATQALTGRVEDQAETLGVQIKEAEHISGTLCTQLDERGRHLDTRIEKATEAAAQIAALLREEGLELQGRLHEARQATEQLTQVADQQRASITQQQREIEEQLAHLLECGGQQEEALRAGVESARTISEQLSTRLGEQACGLETRLEQVKTSAAQLSAQAESHAQAFASCFGEAEALADRLNMQAEQQGQALDGKIGEARMVSDQLGHLCDRAVDLCDAVPLQELEEQQAALRALLEQVGGQCRTLQSAARTAEARLEPLTVATRQADGLREQLSADLSAVGQAGRQTAELREQAELELASLREQLQAVKAVTLEVSQSREHAERAEDRCAERVQEVDERLSRSDEQLQKLNNSAERAEKVATELGRQLEVIQKERKEAEAARRGLLRERVLADAAANKLMELRRELASEARRSPVLLERLRESADKGRPSPAAVAERSVRALDPLRALRGAEIAPPRPINNLSDRLDERIQQSAESGVSV
ncbi:MAG: AAA family ATPase [Phycisphaerales bacterium]|nr:AAA family ATPase [Phycisphaerales bacterium]